jgi:hypothetical protein
VNESGDDISIEKSPTITYGCITREIEIARELEYLYKLSYKDNAKMIDKRVGELLGYPDCCIDFFVNRKNNDPIYESAINSPGEFRDGEFYLSRDIDPKLFSHIRYFGVRLIPWFACSFNCKESSKKAKIWHEIALSINKSLTEELFLLLQQPSSWDIYSGQILINHKDFLGYVTTTSNPSMIKKVAHFNKL